MGVIGSATLSLMTSEIAVNKATNKQAKEFANFELLDTLKKLNRLAKDRPFIKFIFLHSLKIVSFCVTWLMFI